MWHPKNYIPDRAVLRMSYLKFLFYVIQQAYEDINLIEDLATFLQEVTKSENVEIRYKELDGIEDPFEKLSFRISIYEAYFNEQEFDDIREIILEQNGSSLDYIESYNPDLEKRLEFMNNSVSLDLKDEIYTFCAMTGLSENEAGIYRDWETLLFINSNLFSKSGL